jgi:hypothetical protein
MYLSLYRRPPKYVGYSMKLTIEFLLIIVTEWSNK